MIWTISSLLEWTKGYFEKHGTDSPRLEAEILLSHSLKLKRLQLLLQHEREMKESELAEFKLLVLRRVKNEPVAYITGFKPFMTLELAVTPDVLIPRPETEHLVEAVLDIVKNNQALSCQGQISILDIGTGSGAISISLAHYLKNSKVTAVDISEKALDIAKSNALKLGVQEKITFIKITRFHL